MKKEKIENLEIKKDLKKYIKKDSEIIIIIHSVSRSGMQRKMSAYAIYKKRLVNLNWHVEKLGIARRDKNCKLIINGCGMDMAFNLSYRIKCNLYGYETGINNQQYRTIY
jgi:hypothetical protein